MPISPGTRLGPYEIESALGAGGMGEVYRARDTRLDRAVAIKVLASHLSSSPELKQRLEREARAISSLNHPNICLLYDVGSHDGMDYLVMEFLEGETLAERLRKGALGLNELLKIGMTVAEALEIAHKHGIVHRDLKPGNVMLAPAGAKLMDFGLAKPLGLQGATAPSGSVPSFTAAPTMSGASPFSPLTTAGSIVGTIQYMSPEQIEGKEADVRSDIFGLGAVLYEMAAGKRPFEGKSQISVASAILEKDPEPISTSQPATPPAFERIVKTCLEKNPDDRFQSAHDVKIQLKWIAEGGSSAAASLPVPVVPKRKNRPLWSGAIVAAAILGAVMGALLYRTEPSAAVRTVINPPEKTTLNLIGDSAGPPVLSPDGRMLAFTATAPDGKINVWIRQMDSLEPRILPGSEGAIFPFWSPDSRSLGFFADSKLKISDLNGGSVQAICDAPFGRGAAWGPGGDIVFSPNTQAPLMRVSVNGGSPVAITKVDNTQHTSHRWPYFLPDGKHFLYLAIQHDPTKSANNTLYYASLDGRENRPLFHSQSNGIFAAGFLLFARGDQLLAQSFNPGSGKLSGEPRSTARNVANDISTWHMDATASDSGLLAYGVGGSADLQLVWASRGGKEVSMVADNLPNLQSFHISPQGDRVAMQLDSGQADIWVMDMVRGTRTRLTFGPVSNMFPVWSPDGKWIVYTSDRNGKSNLLRKASDGSGAEELLLTDENVLAATNWTQDGQYLLYSRCTAGLQCDVWALPLQGDRKPWEVVVRRSLAASASASPDNHWIFYDSDESGRPEVYVAGFRGGQGKWQVSANGGSSPVWSRDGKELYYLDLAFNLLAVPVKEVGGALQFGAPQQFVTNWSAPQVFFDVTRDGKKVLLDRVSQRVNQSITVVTNWTGSMKK